MTQIGPSLPQTRGPSTSWLYLFRLILLLLCSILNAAALGVILREVIVDENVGEINIIGVTSGVLTLVLIPAMLIVARIRENTLMVYILTEVVIFGVLGILWTVPAALTIQDFNFFGCGGLVFADDAYFCEQLSAKRGLAIATFVLLLFYALTLSIYAVVRTFTVGSTVWFQTVKEQRLRPPNATGSAAHAMSAAAFLPSMWDEKTTDEVRYEHAAASINGSATGNTPEVPPSPPSFGVTTYPPTMLSQAVSMQMAAANSVPSAGPALDASASSTTNLPGSIGVKSAMATQQHHSPASQQENMRIISRSSPQRQGVGLQNTVAYQGAPVTPPYPQV